MATQVDERVVSMKFDNADFEKRSRETLKSLQQLDNATSQMNGAKGLQGLAQAAKEVDLTHIEKQASNLEVRFSALQVVALTTFQRMTNAAITAGTNMVKALTIQPISTGFNEYELKMGSIQTIMAGTGESIETVNRYLDELNTYSDRTIYSFSDMTQSIGKFTNAGVKLDKAVAAIKGVSNVAAVSGANANEASRAMYNFAQALSAGYVKLIDWKSIELANMGTVEFKNQLMETAVAVGTLTKTSDGMYKTLKGNVFNATKNFNELLQDQWMTTDVLVGTLSAYADETTEIGKKAYASAQDVKTFTMLLDTLKEAAQSGWATTYELIFGNFEEAKTLWSSVNDVISEVISKTADERNNILREWKQLGGRDELIASLGSTWKTLLSFIEPVKQAIQDLFPPMTGQRLYEITKSFKDFVTSLKLSEESAYTLKVAIKTLILPVKAILELSKIGIVIIAALFKAVWNLVDYIVSIPSRIGTFEKIMKKIFGDENYLSMAESMNKIIDGVSNAFTNLRVSITKAFQSLTGKGASDTFSFITKFKTSLKPLVNLLGSGLALALNTISKFSFSGLVSNIKTFATGIKNGFSAATTAVSDFVKMIVAPVDTSGLKKAATETAKAGTTIAKEEESISAFDRLANGAKALKDILAQLGDALVTVVSRLTPYKIILLALGVGIVSTVFGMANALEAITSATKKMGNVFKGFSNIITAIKNRISTDKIKSTATALLILAGALVAISQVPSEKLWSSIGAMGAMAGMMTAITVAVALMDKHLSGGKLGVTMRDFGVGMTSASAGILLMAFALRTLSGIDLISMVKSFVTMVASMVALSVAMRFLAKLEISSMKPALSIVALASALTLIASALNQLSQNDYSGIQKNVAALTLAIGALIALSAAVRLAGGVGRSVALLLVIADYVALVMALRLLANMDAEGVYTGLLKFIPVFGVLATMAVIARVAGANKSGMNFLAMASSVLILAKTIELLNGISREAVTRGALIAGGLILVLGIAARIMTIGENMKIGRAASQFVAMGIAIAALSFAIKYFGGIDDKSLGKGTVVVGTLIVLLGFLVRMTSYASKATFAILSLTGMLGILLVSLALLTSIPVDEIYPAAVSLGIVLVAFGASLRLLGNMAVQINKSIPAVVLIGLLVFALAKALEYFKDLEDAQELIPVIASLSLVILAMGRVCNNLQPLKFWDYLPTVVVMGLFIAAIGVALSTLNLIDPAGVLYKAIALSAVLVALGVAIGTISGFGSPQILNAYKAIMAEAAALLAGASVALIALSHFTDTEGLILKATALSEVLLALSVAISMISLFGSVNNVQASGAIISETAVLLYGAATALKVLDKLNPEGMIPKATALSILLLGLSVSIDILGMFKGSLDAAITASMALGSLILILGGVIAAFGVFTQIPGFEKFMTSGVQIFGAVGTAIGLFVGNLVSGLITGITTGWLSALAMELGTFATNFSSFCQTIMGINEEAFARGDKIVKMVETFSSVKTKDAKELVKFGKELPGFAKNLKKYFDTIAESDKMVAGSMVTDSISTLIDAFPEDMSKFKDSDLAQFGLALASFGHGVVSYYNSIKGVTFDQQKISASVAAGTSVATLANSLPGTGGWLQTILGDKDIGLFGSRLSSFGLGILAYWNAIKIANIDTGIVDNVTESAKKIVRMLADLPSTGGWLQGILGEKDYSGFVTNLPQIGSALASFFNAITISNADATGRVSRIDKTVVSDACESLSTIINTLKDLPNSGGLLGDIFGNKDLSGFASGLTALGTGVTDFVTAIGGTNENGKAASSALDTVNSFIDVLDQLQEAIDKANTGTKEKVVSLMDMAYETIKEYRDEFFDSGQYVMEGFINGVKSKHASLEYEMQNMAQVAIDTTNEKFDEHSPSRVFAKIGENVVLGFCNGVRNNQNVANTRMVKMGEGILKSIRMNLGIRSPSTVMRDEVGRYIVQGVAEGITADMSAEEAAEKKAESIVNAFKDTFDRIKLISESIDIDQELYEAMNPDASGQGALNQAMNTLQRRLENQAEQVRTQEAAYKALVQSGYATQDQILEQENKWKQEQTKMYELSKQLLDAQEQTQGTTSDRMVAYAQYIAESKDDLLALGFTMEQIQAAAAEKTGYMMETAADSAQLQFKTVQDVFDHYVQAAEVIVKEPIVKAMTTGIGGGISAGAQAVAEGNVANGEMIGSSLINEVTNAITNGDLSSITNSVKEKFVGSGTYVWEGIVDGASSGLEKLGDIGSALWNKINGKFQEEGEIASPSKVMYQNGVWLVEGLANGINDSAPLAYDAMSNLVNGAASSYSNAGTGLVNGIGDGLTNGEVSTIDTMTQFLKNVLTQIDSNQQSFYTSGNNLSKQLCDGMTNGFTTYFQAVTNAVTVALEKLEQEVKMKAESIAQSVNQALSQAAQIGVSGDLTPVKYNDEKPNVGIMPIKVPAYKRNGTASLARATQSVVGSTGTVGKVLGAVAAVAGSTIVNFTQNNTSPKALSRTEVYRDTKNGAARLASTVSSITKSTGGRKK